MNVWVVSRVCRVETGRDVMLRATAAALGCLLAADAWALDDQRAMATAAQPQVASQRLSSQLELSSTTVARFDNVDGAPASTRIGLTWLPPRRSALGLSVGATRPSGLAPAGAPALVPPPNVDLGLQWRYRLDNSDHVDVTAWRRMTPIDAASLVQSREPTYGARVELQLNSAPGPGLVADKGFLGLQLEGGGRITIRRSGGKPMLYYRTKF